MKSTVAMARIATAMVLSLALGAAMAHPWGPGAGGGHGRGPGYGFGPNYAPGWSLMTEDERIEHRNAMHSFKSYDECKAYMSEFAKRMQQRATEKGTMMRGPDEFACDRMRERGFFK
jgi:hypothetical protein